MIKYGGHIVGIKCRYPYTYELCKEYLTCAKAAEFIAEADETEVEKIKKFLKDMHIRDDVAESEAIHLSIAENVLETDELILHSAVCAVDNVGFGFIARSGTGKTTHMMLWKELLGERVRIINGDKPLISLKQNGVFASGTPWCGKERYSECETVPLKAMAFLERGENNSIVKLTPHEAEVRLFEAVVMSKNMTDNIMPVIRLVNRLSKSVDFYLLKCNKELKAAEVAYGVMR